MNTAFLLVARYDGRPIIPIETVREDFFPHLTLKSLVDNISAGKLALPMVRIGLGTKTAKGVHLTDLARYIDERAEAARKECHQLTGQWPPRRGGST